MVKGCCFSLNQNQSQILSPFPMLISNQSNLWDFYREYQLRLNLHVILQRMVSRC